MIPVIVGFCGLVAETSLWYYRHRNIQDAADLAAFGGAIVLGRGGDEAAVAAAVRADAIANGWRAESGTIEVFQAGPVVQVVLVENQKRYFTRYICGTPTIAIGARAVAVSGGGRAKLVWDEDESDTSGRLSTGCSKVQAVQVKDERRN